MQTTTTELIKVEEITSIMSTASDVLAYNESLHRKALAKAQGLLDTIEGQGMDDEIDAEVNKWQLNAKKALELFNAKRAPITQMAQAVVKAFTALEAPLDPTKKDSIYSTLQMHRNSWAKKKAEKQREEEAKILRKQNVEKEKIELVAKIERVVREKYVDKLLVFKRHANSLFNSITLETIEATKKAIGDLSINYPRDKFYEIEVPLTAVYLEKSELASLIFDTRASLYDELSTNFRENMEDIKADLIEKIPSKKLELEEIANADAENKKRLEKEAEDRKLKEEARLKEQAETSKKQAEENINLQQQMASANTLFDTSAQLADAKAATTGKTREGYKINVLNPSGWGAIFLFYFEKEAANSTVEDMGKKTLNQMKSYCEKYAHKHNEKITSLHLNYEEDFKAVVTKA